MGTVKVELVPWLSTFFGVSGSGRLILEEPFAEGETVGDLLRRLGERAARFGEVVFDPATGEISRHLHILINGLALDLAEGPRTRLKDGDYLVALPAYVGG